MNKSAACSGHPRPELSIIIGSHNARSSIGECLTAIQNQLNGHKVEIIVVDNSTDGTTEILNREFPDLTLIRSAESLFIPQLWEVGIDQSSGEIVAITTAHCVPDNNWVKEIIKAHETRYAGIGGAIENDEAAGLAEWAIYFLRYSPFMLPFPQEAIKEIAGDNASYKREALDLCKDARRHGFWEPVVHAELKKKGHHLLRTPAIVVFHKKSFGVLSFIKQRFWHGRQFGSDRALSISRFRRALYVLSSPLIPLVFLSRITRQVLRNKRRAGKFVLSLPILILFLLSWSAGEFSGYLWATGRSDESN